MSLYPLDDLLQLYVLLQCLTYSFRGFFEWAYLYFALIRDWYTQSPISTLNTIENIVRINTTMFSTYLGADKRCCGQCHVIFSTSAQITALSTVQQAVVTAAHSDGQTKTSINTRMRYYQTQNFHLILTNFIHASF